MDVALQEFGAAWAREDFERWGHISELNFKLEYSPDEYFLDAASPDREVYVVNAEHPNTRRNYERMRELLVVDPEWNDGEIVDMRGVGGI